MRNYQHLVPVIENLPAAAVACAGDVMLDHFVYGEVSRISPEAPIPVLRVERSRLMLGGAGNAVRNLSSLGCKSWLFSVAGDDDDGARMGEIVSALPGCRSLVEREPGRRTPVKTRYVAQGQQLLRADSESTAAISRETVERLLGAFTEALAGCSAVLLSDYGKGVLAGEWSRRFIQAARGAGKPVIVDPKGRDYGRYRGATLIKPNLKELAEATGLPVVNEAEQETAARRLMGVTEADSILVTLGAAGMMLIPARGAVLRFPALAREVYDVSGAGDTVAAVLAAAMSSGASMEDAVEAANIAAGIVVSKAGTAVVDCVELMDEVQHRLSIGARSKVLKRDEAVRRVRRWKQMGGTVGLVHGRFDRLEPRDIEFLEAARAHCDRLLAGLQSDAAAAVAGGAVRNQAARALMLASLNCVDGVVVFEENTPGDLIGAIRPDLLVVAGEGPADYTGFAELAAAWGGEVLYVPMSDSY